MQSLTELQKRLCNRLQRGLPICERPFACIAGDLGTDEKTVLEQIAQLKQAGVIRRLSAVINHRSLGKASTLVAATIPPDLLDDVVEAVNALEGVSHNYLRGTLARPGMKEEGRGTRDDSSIIHHPSSIDEGIQYGGMVPNLWFTLQGADRQDIERTLAGLAGRFGVEFHNLPAERMFKLDVFFDLEERERDALQIDKLPYNFERAVELDANDKIILLRLQDELELTTEPFALFCTDGLGHQQVLRIINELIGKGVIRRLSAVLNHRRLGFIVNVLFVCQVPPHKVIRAGERLAGFRMVSHCYERKTFPARPGKGCPGWPYNLFAMFHSRSMEEIQAVINGFVEAETPESYILLPSVTELKKQPVRQKCE